MALKGSIVGGLFLILGFIILFLHLIIQRIDVYYLLIAYAFTYILTGLTIFVRITVRSYRIEHVEGGFEVLKERTHFYIIEFAKVTVCLFLAFEFPLEVFILFVILDCLDGFCLPYKVRSTTLRHRIDKFTDLLCQTPFFVVAVWWWPTLTPLFAVTFVLVVVKTALFLKSGNRDYLCYIPNLFTFLFPVTLLFFRFLPCCFESIFFVPYHLTILVSLVLLVSVLFEVIYNGVFARFRYRVEGGVAF